MAEPSAQIAVFAKIPDDKIRALADALDESIVRRPSAEKIREVVGAHLSESDAASVATVFYNFVSQAAPQRITRAIDAAPLEDRKKDVLRRALESVHEKSDARKISQMASIADLDVGRPRLCQPKVHTELRPTSDDGEITGMAPKLFISGVLREPNARDDRPVSVQMDSEEGRKLAEQISEQLKVGRYWAFPDTGRTVTKHEAERAKNAVNKKAYLDFVAQNSTNPEFKGKFVAFVHGKFEGSGRSQADLVYRMYDKFGNVPMYVSRASGIADVVTVTPVVLCPE